MRWGSALVAAAKPLDRIHWMAVLVVACFVSVLILPSQSAASYPSYVLSLVMLVYCAQWKDVLETSLFRLIIGLLIWLSLSALWSEPLVWREAFSVWTRTVLVVCFVVAVAECQLRGHMQRWLVSALASVGVFAVLTAIVVFYVTRPLDGRLNGLGQLDTHVIAALVYGCVGLFALRLLVLESRTPLTRVGVVMLLGIITCAIYLSDSRNAWVSVLIGWLVYLIALVVRDRQQFVATMMTAFVIGGVSFCVCLNDEVLRDWMLPRGDSFRLLIWNSTLERLFAGSWLFGLGILTPDGASLGGSIFTHPHNMYLAVFYQGGAVGLLLYLVLLLRSVQILLKNFTSSDAKLALGILALALAAHLLDGHNLIDKVGDTWFLIWLPVAIALAHEWHQPQHRNLV